MNRHDTYLYQLRSHLMYYFVNEVYVDTAQIAYDKIKEEEPELVPLMEVFEDVFRRKDYAVPFKQVIEIYLGKEIPRVPTKNFEDFIGALVYCRGMRNGIGIIENNTKCITQMGLGPYRQEYCTYELVSPEEIDKFWFVLRQNRTLIVRAEETIFDNVAIARKFDWRGGMKGSGRFKKAWAESALNSFFSGIFSPANTDGLTKQKLYDILEESADDSLACRHLMEVLLEQITAETPTTES